MADWPVISIVVATRNRCAYLKRMLDHLLRDDYPNLEVIVVDGASTDGTVNLLKSYGDRMARWISEPDRGEYDATNKAIRMATGEIVKWMTDDDLLRPGVFHKAAEYLAVHPDIDVVFGQTAYWRETDREPVFLGTTSATDPARLGLRYWLRESQGVSSQASFFRKRIFDYLGPFSIDYVCGDTEFWVRAASRCVPMGLMPDVVLDYYYTGLNGAIVKSRRVTMDVIRINSRYGSVADILHAVFRRLIRSPVRSRIARFRAAMKQRANPSGRSGS